ncbi:MAG: hypothetical protein WD795_20880 [Woeseia sp.]
MCRVILLVLWLALSMATAHAADDSPLSPFGFLAGHCWSGEFEESGATDTHCYTWVFGGKHLRDVHVVSGEEPDYRGETIYSVEGTSGDIIFRYWNSLGGVSDGRIELEDGAILAPGGTYVGEDGKAREFRSSLRQIDDMHYEALTEERIDDEWRNFSRVTFTRTNSIPTAPDAPITR